jgi:hypothetical protein
MGYTGKLSASSLGTFLTSPKQFYWRYIAKLQPINNSVATYDHDKICGVVWAEFVDRFYKGMSLQENTTKTLSDWDEQTDGWVPEKAKDRLTTALDSWSGSYYQMFSPDDGCRTAEGSELFVENDRFLGYLDGFSADGIVHEVKSTSRSPQLAGQLWKVTNSIQVKLYCVLTEANGVCIEFAFKDKPHALFRGPITPVSAQQRKEWEQEINTLADHIYSLGDDPHNYVCNPDRCCLVTRGVTSMCSYELACEHGMTPEISIGFKPKTRRK